MFIIIRQNSKNHARFTTRCRVKLSLLAYNRAVEIAKNTPTMENGYFDVVLSTNPNEQRGGVDSDIAIR